MGIRIGSKKPATLKEIFTQEAAQHTKQTDDFSGLEKLRPYFQNMIRTLNESGFTIESTSAERGYGKNIYFRLGFSSDSLGGTGYVRFEISHKTFSPKVVVSSYFFDKSEKHDISQESGQKACLAFIARCAGRRFARETAEEEETRRLNDILVPKPVTAIK